MSAVQSGSSLTSRDLARAWWRVLNGHVPMLSIEITRACPLSCPGCYAYGNTHLGGETTLRDLADFRGNALVEGVLELVRRHRPMHVSLVGGEPMIRHRELSRILPALSEMGVFTMVVTSGVIAIPADWMGIPRLRIAVSVDGLPEHHDERRKPATYERILKNIAGRSVNVHWVITRPMLSRSSYLEEYVAFWNARPEVDHIWVSLYSPQIGEESAERLTPEDRERVARELPRLGSSYPKLLLPEGMARAFVSPPQSPDECLFSEMSMNYSADLRTRRTVRLRRHSGLQPVWMQHQQRTALDSGCEGRRAGQRRAPGANLALRGLGGSQTAIQCRGTQSMGPGRPVCGAEDSADSD